VKSRYDTAATTRLLEAVRNVESRSCAELVLEIHARSGSYAHADARFGALLAFLSLVAILFLPVAFPVGAILVDAVVFFAVGHFVSSRSSTVRHLMTSARERDQAVRTRAGALFYERGMANTMGETGLLLFVSLLERRMELVADRGLLRMVPPDQWNSVHAELRASRDVTPEAVIALIQRLGSMLHVCAPAGEQNPDELANAPQLNLT
jgi:putative membrane protein